ncbi:MAG: hypothetical protein JW913_14115 [Chitinispirillaceae bacterium]|nr:hypothetical protein [Chitinispirillaceae bacterium]
MHRFHSITTGALLSIIFTGLSTMAQYPAQVKIITYNINAETHTDGNYADIAGVIKEINPTIAGLQKVDSCTVTAKPVDVLKYLGEQANMAYTFSMSYKKNNGSYGNGFLSDSVPKNSRRLAIPKGSSSEDRSALEIGITMGGEPVRVIVTHLAYDGETYRTAQLQKILPWIDSGGTATDPVVIMADFNAQHDAGSMKLLTDAGFVFVKGKNGVILDSTQKINHILYRPAASWTLVDAGNPKYTASNRNPVWADLKLNPVAAAAPAMQNKLSGDLQPLFSRGLLHYNLASPANVSLHLYTTAGKLVKTVIDNRHQEAGDHTASIGENSLSRGLYHGILSVDGRIIAATTIVAR